jgi:NitT/TauT family transport system substrate-binding protein
VLLSALIVATLGCSRIESVVTTDASSTPSPSSAQLTTLKMNFLPALTYSAFMIAKDEGYFAQEGIDAQLVSIDGQQVILAATSGELDVISMPVRPGIFNTILRGADLRIVADKGHSAPGPCSAEAFSAPIATAERIEKNKSFRGERFAKQRATHIEFLIDRLLEKNGLTRDDVEFVELSNSEYVAAIQDKINAVLYTSEPKMSNLISQGLVKMVIAAEDIEPGHQFSVVTFGKRLLHDDPELGRRFMRAYIRGVRQYNEGKTDRNVEIISRYTKFPPEIIRRSCWIPIYNDARVRPEGLSSFMAWALKNEYLDADVPVSMWWDGSYIDAAEASLGQEVK